jgi:hypothetical protein
VLFEPLELLQRLAAVTPRPRIHLILYHGVLAPHARWRARVMAYGRVPAATVPPPNVLDGPQPGPTATSTRRYWPWASARSRSMSSLARAASGRLCLIATVEDPREIRDVLDILARADTPWIVPRPPTPSRRPDSLPPPTDRFPPDG